MDFAFGLTVRLFFRFEVFKGEPGSVAAKSDKDQRSVYANVMDMDIVAQHSNISPVDLSF